MPTYTYECPDGHRQDRVMTIAEMSEFEGTPQKCHCNSFMVRVLMPPRRHVTFHEGFYEHVSEDGHHVSSMSELRRIAKENGNYSVYAEDLGGLFRAKEGRWI